MGFEQITGPNSIAPTPPTGDISNRVATTAFISSAISVALSTSVFYPSLTVLTNSLSSDHLVNNVSNYFDGPTVTQGTSGTWYASGEITVQDTAGAAGFNIRLWDGTSVIASARQSTSGAGNNLQFAISGVITSPASNIRISVQDVTSTNGKIIFNASGNSKDCTITVIRIA